MILQKEIEMQNTPCLVQGGKIQDSARFFSFGKRKMSGSPLSI